MMGEGAMNVFHSPIISMYVRGTPFFWALPPFSKMNFSKSLTYWSTVGGPSNSLSSMVLSSTLGDQSMGWNWPCIAA